MIVCISMGLSYFNGPRTTLSTSTRKKGHAVGRIFSPQSHFKNLADSPYVASQLYQNVQEDTQGLNK